jgi:hypothetical protein
METKPPMRYRKLRIAWSVVCGTACIALIVFLHSLPQPVAKRTLTPFRPYVLGSEYGWTLETLTFGHSQTFFVYKHCLAPHAKLKDTLTIDLCGFGWQRTESMVYIAIPYLFWVAFSVLTGYVLSLMLSAALYIPGMIPARYSLRTLLIAVTLIAIALGLIIYLVRNAH